MNAVRCLLFVLLALVWTDAVSQLRGERGPHGHWLPAWLRIVDVDGQVTDIQNIVLDAITLCPTEGDGSIWSYEPGRGIAIIELAGGQVRQFAYGWKGYNTGAVTANPNITGDQVLLTEQPDAIFASGGEDCWRHYYGVAQ